MRKTATQHRGSLPSFIAHDETARRYTRRACCLRSALPCRLLVTHSRRAYVHLGQTNRCFALREIPGRQYNASATGTEVHLPPFHRSTPPSSATNSRDSRGARCPCSARCGTASRGYCYCCSRPHSLHTLSLLSSPLIIRGASQYSTPLHPATPVTRIVMIRRCVDKVATVRCVHRRVVSRECPEPRTEGTVHRIHLA
jgi:hypothetical protein